MNSRPRRISLARCRPIAWREILPAAAIGLVLGQSATLNAGPGVALPLAAAALLCPALLVAHRRWGTVACLGAVGALCGHAQVALEAPPVKHHFGDSGNAVSRVVGQVQEVWRGEWRPAEPWTRLEVRLAENASQHSALREGSRVRLSIAGVRGAWRIGEMVQFSARLREPRGLCNLGRDGYAAWLRRRGVVGTAHLPDEGDIARVDASHFASLSDAVTWIRGHVSAAVERAVPGDSGRILRAIVVGDRSGISRQMLDAFARTGTAHLLAVSGMNLGLVAMAVLAVARTVVAACPSLVGRMAAVRIAAVIALPVCTAYTALAGGAIPVVRAMVMAALLLVGTATLRRSDALVSLCCAGGLLCAMDPEASADASFQLSFVSVGAIVFGLARLQSSLGGRWLAPRDGDAALKRARAWVLGSVAVSALAGAWTAPLTAFHFGAVPLVGIPMNLVTVPLLGVGALALGLAGVALLPVWEGLAGTFFRWGGALVTLAGEVVMRVARWPWACLDVAPPSGVETAAWLVLLALPLLRPPRWRPLAVLAVVCLIAGRLERSPPLRVSFLDVGQGDSSIVELAVGRRLLVIDGGARTGSFDAGERVLLPALRAKGARHVSAAVLSHPDQDHYGGLRVLTRQMVTSEIWRTGSETPSQDFGDLLLDFSQRQVRTRLLRRGAVPITAGPDGELRILHPPLGSAKEMSKNDGSLVALLRYGALALLFTGDIEARGESALLGSGLDAGAAVLKAPHHGSRTSSSRALVRAVRPSLVVAMLGAGNPFGFPAREVVDRYRQHGAEWLETGRVGEIVLESDGQVATVQTCRTPQS